MAGSVNKVILLGRLGGDPEIRVSQEGTKIARFSVATSESWKDKTTGEYKNRTSWHKIICKGDRNTKYASQYLKKGMNVMVEGKQENRTYEIEGHTPKL